jgi:hypothetical protein
MVYGMVAVEAVEVVLERPMEYVVLEVLEEEVLEVLVIRQRMPEKLILVVVLVGVVILIHRVKVVQVL